MIKNYNNNILLDKTNYAREAIQSDYWHIFYWLFFIYFFIVCIVLFFVKKDPPLTKESLHTQEKILNQIAAMN
jgi:hypothetical protein